MQNVIDDILYILVHNHCLIAYPCLVPFFKRDYGSTCALTFQFMLSNALISMVNETDCLGYWLCMCIKVFSFTSVAILFA